MQLLVHPMAEYLIAFFYTQYPEYQKATVAQIISWIERGYKNRPKSISYEIEYCFGKPPQDDDHENYLHMPRLCMSRARTSSAVRLDGNFSIGNLVSYETMCLMLNDSLFPFSVREMMSTKVTEYQKNNTNPLLASELFKIEPGDTLLPQIPVDDIRHGLYGEYTGFSFIKSWHPWDEVRTRLLTQFRISPDNPHLKSKLPLIKVAK